MPQLEVKGRETAYQAHLLLLAGKAACDIDDLMPRRGRCLSQEDSATLLATYLQHVSFFLLAGGKCVPKHHLMVHMMVFSQLHGNPIYYHTYKDESLNGVVARIAKHCHRWTFHITVHKRFSAMQELNLQMGMH